jgi:hypothetical protein
MIWSSRSGSRSQSSAQKKPSEPQQNKAFRRNDDGLTGSGSLFRDRLKARYVLRKATKNITQSRMKIARIASGLSDS